jgi:predicted  nucleic acid-binding Zn-ribbon protein
MSEITTEELAVWMDSMVPLTGEYEKAQDYSSLVAARLRELQAEVKRLKGAVEFEEQIVEETMQECQRDCEFFMDKAEKLEAEVKRLEEKLHMVREWAHVMGSQLCPGTQWHDTFGEGVRATKKALLDSGMLDSGKEEEP